MTGPEHPQYAMWREKYDSELAARRTRAEQLRRRHALRREWDEAWRTYEVRWHAGLIRGSGSRPAWGDLRGWLRWLLVKDIG